jgi:endoglycosylceramidase
VPTKRRRIAALLAALAVGGLVPAPPASAAEIPGPLHVDGTRLRDADGRDVILRGIAVINKKPPFYPDVDASDFRRIRDLGLNHIRLGISWAGVMPREGEIDRDYLAAVDDIVAGAQQAGLWVVVDMHQDLYGGARGNGAPDWAFRPMGCPHVELAEPTGAWSANYLSPEVSCAFTNFWLAEDLQARYRDTWTAVARAVGARSNVIGYDLMNEPWPGYLPPTLFERFWLYPRQAQWLRAIRTADPDAIGFVEPSVLKTLTLVSPPPAGMLPANSVYSPHLYGPWDATSEYKELEQTRVLADTSFAASRRDAEGAGVPLWVGEWGVFTSAGGAAEFATHVYDLTDDARAGNAIWEYGDTAYGPYDPATWQPTPLYDAVLRPYPEAVPGTLTGISYDPKARTLDVQWENGSAGTVRLRVPEARYPEGVAVTGSEQWQWNAATSVLTAKVLDDNGHLRLTPR